MSMHQRIKQRRLALKLSLAQLGEQIGTSWQTIQQWERPGGTMPLRKRRVALAKALGCSEEWLETGREAAPLQATADGRIYIPVTSEEEVLLQHFRTITAEQRAYLMGKLREMSYGKVVIERVKGSPLANHASDSDVESAFGTPGAAPKRPQAPR